MVKEVETNTQYIDVNNVNEKKSEHTNGNCYNDSLKLDISLKKKNLSNSEKNLSQVYNGNGLLSELVVNVSNVHKNLDSSPTKQMNQIKKTNGYQNNFDFDKENSNFSSLSIKMANKENLKDEINCTKKTIKVTLTDKNLFVEVIFFIKNIIKNYLTVEFQEKSLQFKFKTSDKIFLDKHGIDIDTLKANVTKHRITNGKINGTTTQGEQFNQLKVIRLDENKLPTFTYSVETLYDKIDPEECEYKLLPNQLVLILQKKNTIKWDSLELIKNEMCIDYLKNASDVLKNQNGYDYKKKNSLIDSNKSKLNDDIKDIENKENLENLSNQDNIKLNNDNLNNEKNDSDFVFQTPILIDNGVNSDSKNKSTVNVDEDNEEFIPVSEINKYSESAPKQNNFPALPNNKPTFSANLGYTGLSNLGNTCYMNSILQCLSNTIELRDYFLNDSYKKDLNKDNPFGTGCKVAEAFSELLNMLWSGQNSYSPSYFKMLIGNTCYQFAGYSQHDAVEFMEHFLDILHEDLNKVDRKNVQPAQPILNEDELTDEQLANEQWKRHKERNDSIITDLFYGQYKSKLVCPKCSKVSITFDPFLYLPIPLTKNKIVYTVYFFPLDFEQPPTKISIELPQGSKIANLLAIVSLKTEINQKELVACLINQSGELEQEFRLTHFIPDSAAKTSKVYIYQTPQQKSLDKFIVFQTFKNKSINKNTNNKKCEFCNHQLPPSDRDTIKCSKCLKTSYFTKNSLRDMRINMFKSKNEPNNIGTPFIFFDDIDSLKYKVLMEKLENIAVKSVNIIEREIVSKGHEIEEGQLESELKSDSESIENNEEKKEDLCEDEVNEKESNLNDNFKFVLYGKKSELSSESELIYIPEDESEEEEKKFLDSVKSYYYLFMDWKESYVKQDEFSEQKSVSLEVFSKNLNLVASNESNCSLKQEKSECTLEESISKFTESETLSIQEAWVCPKCKEPREANKDLTIWRPPKILIIQLKRFSYNSYVREKIDKFVNYPIKGLDISKFCSNSSLIDEVKPIYDLYGVIDHYGGLCGGHYTADATSSFNDKNLGWRVFNDSSVRDTDAESVISRSAYVLFYRLRSSDN